MSRAHDARRVTSTLYPRQWDQPLEVEAELNEWQVRRRVDRELDAALLADALEHRHRRERMPQSIRVRDEVNGDVRSILDERERYWRARRYG